MTDADRSFELVSSLEDFIALEPEWRALLAASSDPSWFLDPDWIAMVWRRVLADREPAPQIALVREGGRLVLALPLQRIPFRLPFTRWSGLWNPLPGYTEPLLAPEGDAAAWLRLVFARIRGLTTRSLVLPRVRETSRFYGLIADRIRTRLDMGRAPVVDLANGYDAYFSTFTGPSRRQVSRMFRRLGDSGAVGFRVSTPQTFDADFSWFLEKKRAWTPPGGRPLRSWLRPAYEGDLRSLAPRWVADGRMRLWQLEVGDRRVASALAFFTGKTAAFFAITYDRDPAFAHWSPGRLATLKMLEASAAAGITHYDFMAGEFDWKVRLGTSVAPVYRLRLSLG
jgi:CelD/BcsL family acetyltransferase involved in cellulose biosynthesis